MEDETPAPPSRRLRQASLARLSEYGIVPKRSLGQNFLIDDNILQVIMQRLQPGPDDVILEVGAGLGVLTGALAHQAALVHAFEIDRSLEAPLRATLGPLQGKVTLHFEDALQSRLEELDPPPTLCASNLPYSPAAPFLAESLARLPGVRRYVVMVQKEVAERLAARPGSKTYGSLSAWVQLHGELREVRPLSRSIFHPRPNVDSSLVTIDRRPLHPDVEGLGRFLRWVIDAAFSQRRKAIANSLSSSLDRPKGEVTALLHRLGISPSARAEQLAPADFLELARLLAADLPERLSPGGQPTVFGDR